MVFPLKSGPFCGRHFGRASHHSTSCHLPLEFGGPIFEQPMWAVLKSWWHGKPLGPWFCLTIFARNRDHGQQHQLSGILRISFAAQLSGTAGRLFDGRNCVAFTGKYRSCLWRLSRSFPVAEGLMGPNLNCQRFSPFTAVFTGPVSPGILSSWNCLKRLNNIEHVRMNFRSFSSTSPKKLTVDQTPKQFSGAV